MNFRIDLTLFPILCLILCNAAGLTKDGGSNTEISALE